jgi:hypothetical protein
MKYDIPSTLHILTPGARWTLRGREYSGLSWADGNEYDKPTEAELTAKIAELDAAEPGRLLRVERDKRLAETDWKIVKAKELGTNLSADFKAYRQALRDFPSTATPTLDANYNLDLSSVTWPTEPS